MHRLRDLIRPLAAGLALSLLGFSAQASCSANTERNACPIRVGGQVVFDRCFGSLNGRPTSVGNFACNGLRDSAKLADMLGENNRLALQRAEADWKALVKVATDGAIDRDAVRQLQGALSVAEKIQTKIDGVLKDPQCGSRGALEALQRRFRETGELVGNASQAAALTLDAVSRLRPVAAEAAKVAAELPRLLESVNKKGAKAKTEYDALSRALADLQKDLGAVLATDFAGVVAAGGGLATGVVPFVAQCTACAGSLSAAVGALSAGGATTVGGGSACPGTAGVSCALAAVALPTGAVGAGLMTAISTGPCAAAALGMDSMGKHVQDINRFVDGLVKLATALPSSAAKAVSAGQALGRLSAEMGGEGQQSLRSIQTSLNAMWPAFNASAAVLEDGIAPKVKTMAGSFVQGLGRDTALLGRCYGLLMQAAAHMTDDLVSAGVDLAKAATDMVDAGKVVGNLAAQGNDGLRAANKFTADEWSDLNRDMRGLSRRVWGVPFGTVDLPRTGAHLVSLAADSREVQDIAGDGTRLLARAAALPANAINAGKRAFLDQERLTTQARSKYGDGQAKARSAAAGMARLQAKAQKKLDAAPKAKAPVVPSANLVWPTARTQKLAALTVVR